MATQLDSPLPVVPGLEVLEPIGRGSFSHVYRARAGDQVYALKTLDPEQAQKHPEWTREARVRAAWLARVEHPGLPRIVSVGQANGLPYLVTEFAEGQTLAARLAAGPLPEPEIVGIARNLAEALASLHDQGLVHRDVKPDNIILTDERTMLVDVDLLAREAEEGGSRPAGTVRYAAPEVFGLSQRPIDARSDLYSLGAVLFECAAGRPPFLADNAAELAHQQAFESAPSIEDYNPRVSPGLSVIVAKLLAREPDERYQSAQGVMADLDLLATLNTLLREKRQIALGSGDHLSRTRRVLPAPARAAELAKLEEQWRLAVEEKGRVVLLAGTSGSGKAFLARTFAGSVRERRGLVLMSRCREGHATPFGALREGIDAWLEELFVAPLTVQEADKQRIRVAAGDYAPLLSALSPGLALLCGITEALPGGAPPDRFEDVLADFLIRLAGCFGGLLLVIRDMQWLDDSTARVLEALARHIEAAPMLLLATVRAAGKDRAALRGFYDRLRPGNPSILRCGPLRDDAVGQLVTAELGRQAISPEVVKHVATWTDRQPLAIREYLQALINAGVLRLEWGAWTIDPAEAQNLQLPSDVQQLMAYRVASLEPAVARVLRLAAVMGNHIDPELLASAAGQPEQVRDALSAAAAADLIHSSSQGGYDFYHDGVRTALTQSLSEDQLERLHTRVAETLEREGQASDEQIFALARHYALADSAGSAQRIYETNLAAGISAMDTFANAEAYEFLLRAREAAAQGGISMDAELDRRLGEVCARIGRWDEAAHYLAAALDGATQPLDRADVHARKARVHLANRETALAWQDVEQAFHEIGTPVGHSAVARFIYSIWSWIVGLLALRIGLGYGSVKGDRRRRLEQLSELCIIGAYVAYLRHDRPRIVEMVMRQLYVGHLLGDSPAMVSALTSYANVLALMGRSRKAALYAERSIAMAEKLGDRFLLARMRMFRAWQEHVSGAPVAAEKLMRACLRVDGTWLDATDFAYAHIDLAWNLMMRGYCREALAALEPALSRAHPDSGESFNLQMKVAALQSVLGRHSDAAETFRALRGFSLERTASWPRQNYLDHLLLSQVESGEATERVEEVLREYQALGIGPRRAAFHSRHFYVFQAHARLARCTAAGATPEALRAFREALDELGTAAGRHPTLRSHYLVLSGAAARLEGKIDRAVRLLQQAQACAHEADSPWALFEAHRQMAHCLMASHNEEAAVREARLAHRLAVEHGWVNRARWIRSEFEVLRPPPDRAVAALELPSAPRSGDDGRQLQQYLDALLEVSAAAGSSLDPEQQARLALDEVIRILNAERGFLFTSAPNGELTLSSGRTADGQDLAAVSDYSRSVVERVGTTCEPVLLTGSNEGDVMVSDSIIAHELRSIIATPLLRGERLLGVLYVDSQLDRGVLGREQLKVLTALASHIAIAFDTAAAAAEQRQLGRANADLLHALQQRVEELQESRARITAAEERLRKDIAEMLHSRVQSKLLVAGHQLNRLAEGLPREADASREALAEVVAQLDEIREQEIRLASHLLHPSIIRVGLVPAVRSLIGRFEDFFRVSIDVDPRVLPLDSIVDNKLPEALRLTAYRVVEEALTNAQRHARASLVEIKLLLNEPEELQVEIRDNGKGLDPSQLQPGLGISSIAGRVSQLDGAWRIDSRPGRGATVIVTLPLTGGEEEEPA